MTKRFDALQLVMETEIGIQLIQLNGSGYVCVRITSVEKSGNTSVSDTFD